VTLGGRALAVVLTPLLGACGSVRHSVVRTSDVTFPPYVGPVRVSLTREPAGGAPLAIVQVYSFQACPIDRLVPEMTRLAGELGADFVKVDRVKTHFDKHEESRTVTYDCGTIQEPKTCSDTRTETVHEETTQILGRAFRGAR
jgi:hypothetical protein